MKRIENIHSDINKLLSGQCIKLNQANVLNILFMVNEIFTGENESVRPNEKGDFEFFKGKSDKEKQESNEEPDTTDMLELESEEYVEERRNRQGRGLEILTPDQMFSRLPIILAQLKAGNNSQKLKNEIGQLCTD